MAFQILITEDEDHFRLSLRKLLEAEGYLVDTAKDGKDTLELLQDTSYDVVLLDLGLPDLNGLDIAECIIDRYPECGVVILTGQASVNSAIRAVHLGCYDYLTKPCHPRQIIRTVQRAAEHGSLKRQLAASHQKFKMLAEATSEGIVILDGDSVVEFNQQFCDILGLSPETARTLKISDHFPIISTVCSENYLGSQEPQTYETEGIRSDGVILPVELSIRQFCSSPTPCQVITVKDLSHAIRERMRQQALEEKLTYALRMESIGLMAGSVAHDLNNILSGLVTFPELLLLDMPSNEKYRADIERIKHAGQKAADVVADLLTVARGSTCSKEITNLNEFIKEFEQSLAFIDQKVSSPGIQFVIDLAPDLPEIKASPLHLTKTLINLVRNGVEAIEKPSGKILISTSFKELFVAYPGTETIPAGQYVVLSVADTGAGIQNGHIAHIFEPFYTRKEMGKSGSGLGLTIVMHTMQDHNGFIDLQSNSEGTLFELYFPSITEKSTDQMKKAPLISLEELQGNGEKILVVDDEASERSLAVSILQRLGYAPLTASDGQEALRILHRQPIDLLLLDMILTPDMNGYDICRKVREICPKQKMIVTSGHHNHPDRMKLQKAGVTCYLNKPLQLSQLAQALRKEIHRPQV